MLTGKIPQSQDNTTPLWRRIRREGSTECLVEESRYKSLREWVNKFDLCAQRKGL